MPILPIVALTLMAFGCSGPGPAVDTELARGSTAPVTAAGQQQQRPTRFEEALMRLRIRRSLLEHLKAEALNVDVEVVGDTVVLGGTLGERADRMLAEEAALAVRGVGEVDNEIEVAASGPDEAGPLTRGARATERELADAMLELQVQTRLVRELGEVAFRIEVEASDGVVSLRGPIPDETRKRLALESAGKVRGVRQVHDLLKVEE